jgi:hypothetical protein
MNICPAKIVTLLRKMSGAAKYFLAALFRAEKAESADLEKGSRQFRRSAENIENHLLHILKY